MCPCDPKNFIGTKLILQVLRTLHATSFNVVFHEKKIVKGSCYINIYKTMPNKGVVHEKNMFKYLLIYFCPLRGPFI